jgi:tetratricopeptide (TPR) repeat protein
VEELIARGEPLEDIEIPDGWRTAGMVMELCERAFSTLDGKPSSSLTLAEIAFAISAAISADYPEPAPHYLYGRALREVGYAHRYLDSYTPAVRAFESSEKAFAKHGTLLHDQAIAQFSHACVLYRAGRYDDALTVHGPAQDIFESLGDELRRLKCQCLGAIISHEQGDLATARQKYESLLPKALESDDLHTIGLLYQNLGLVDLTYGRTDTAAVAFARARSIFVEIGALCEIDRADWGLAQLFLIENHPDKALPLLETLRKNFLARSMPAAAAEIGLHIVDALVVMNRLDEAKAMNQQTLKECIDHNLNRKAVMALSYLREILQTSANPRRATQHVRSYVQKLRSEPGLLFVPMDEKE